MCHQASWFLFLSLHTNFAFVSVCAACFVLLYLRSLRRSSSPLFQILTSCFYVCACSTPPSCWLCVPVVAHSDHCHLVSLCAAYTCGVLPPSSPDVSSGPSFPHPIQTRRSCFSACLTPQSCWLCASCSSAFSGTSANQSHSPCTTTNRSSREA